LSDHIFKSKVCHFDLEQAEELKPDLDSAETA
jgi:chorismate mutase